MYICIHPDLWFSAEVSLYLCEWDVYHKIIVDDKWYLQYYHLDYLLYWSTSFTPPCIRMWITQFVVTGSHSAEADSQTEWTDVQKKIIPWKNTTPSLDLETAFQDRAAKLGKSNSRLIVVASLIDKPTNLGGKVDCIFSSFYFTPWRTRR